MTVTLLPKVALKASISLSSLTLSLSLSLSLSVRSFSSNAFCMSFLLFHIPHTITNKRRCICIFSLWVFLFVSFSSLTSSNLLIYSLSQIFFYQFILYIVSLLYIPHTFTNKRRCRHLYVKSVCLSVLLHLFFHLALPHRDAWLLFTLNTKKWISNDVMNNWFQLSWHFSTKDGLSLTHKK